MKFVVLSAALLVTSFPAFAAHHGKHHHKVVTQEPIVVSCYRGPWKDVIWDRPNPIFVDSLVNIGYDINTASSIAEKVCRDKDLVGNPEGLKSEMLRIYREIRP